MARKSLSDLGVRALKPRAARYSHPDPQMPGMVVRVTPNGAKSYSAVARDPSGKQVWTTLGAPEVLPIAEARERAREVIRRVKDGLPAVEPRGETFAAVAQEWMARHVRKKGLLTADHVERLLRTRILPKLGNREFASIRRSDIAALLDDIEDRCGPRQADYCLAVFSSVANWFAARDDTYTPPLVKGMGRRSAPAQARARILTDDELRAVWTAAERCGAFGAFVRIALLTGQRRSKLVGMRWSDLDLDVGVWTVAKESPREKGTGGALALPELALNIIRSLPRFADNPFVFAAARGQGRIIGFSKGKVKLDRLSNTSGWALHDLRRSARSLLSRATVAAPIAERILGHAQGGVEAIYDRHTYFDEKADALRRLARQIERILNPTEAQVIKLR